MCLWMSYLTWPENFQLISQKSLFLSLLAFYTNDHDVPLPLASLCQAEQTINHYKKKDIAVLL